MPKKAVALGMMLGRADAHVKAAIHTLDEVDAASVTVRATIETLQSQVKQDPSLLVPSHSSLLAALCRRRATPRRHQHRSRRGKVPGRGAQGQQQLAGPAPQM